jgi:cysteine synthase
VEGIGVGFWPPHLKSGDFDAVCAIDEFAARQIARRRAAEEGILAGTSTGLNVAAAIALAREYGPDATVVTVAGNTGLNYLT